MSSGEIMVSALMIYLIGGGLISWFVMDKKEEDCLKECKRLSRTSQVWMPKLCFDNTFCLWALIMLPGFCVFFLILAIKNYVFGIMLGGITLFLAILYWVFNKACKYPTTYISYPLFAIVNDELIVWEYMGFGKRKVYKLSELSRNEGEIPIIYSRIGWAYAHARIGWVFTLYNKENVPVVYIRYNAYKKAKEITEMLKKIPVVKL